MPRSCVPNSKTTIYCQVDHHSSDNSEGSRTPLRTPSLQRVLISSPTSPSSSEQESFNNIDNLSVIEKAHEKAKAAEKASAVAEGDAVVSRKGVTPLSPIARWECRIFSND